MIDTSNARYRPFDEGEKDTSAAGGDDEAERIAKARDLWETAVDVKGGEGEKYLQSRGIEAIFRLPDVVRWNKSINAVIFPGVDATGKIRFVQAVYIASSGDAIFEKGKKKKLTFGVMRGAGLVLKGNGDPVACDGPEDGLSIWAATMRPTFCSCGIGRVHDLPYPAGAIITLVVDNVDADREAAHKSAERLAAKGHRVKLASMPAPTKDANECLVKLGAKAVQAAVKAAEDFFQQAPPEIAALNADNFIIPIGGRTMVGSFGRTELGAEVLKLTRPHDFALLHNDATVGVRQGERLALKPLGSTWLTHPCRRTYKGGFGFDPHGSHELPDGRLNLWRGWGVKPAPGDWTRLRNHVVKVLANGNEDHARYILNWVAWKLQNPGGRPEAALAFKSGQGAGKGTFFGAIKTVFGAQGRYISNAKHLTGAFNAHLRGACFLLVDEAFWAGDHSARGPLFGLVTEPAMMIEAKGIDAVEEANRLGIVMLTNKDWIVPADADSRRFAVFECSDEFAYGRAPDEERDAYFTALRAEMDHGGLAAMVHDMLGWDIGDWQPRQNIPQTDALQKQKMRSLEGLDRWWFDVLSRGSLPRDPDSVFNVSNTFRDNPYRVETKAAVDEVKSHLKERYLYVSNAEVARYLLQQGLTRKKSGAIRGYEAGPLKEHRQMWEKRFGGAVDWDDPEANWTI